MFVVESLHRYQRLCLRCCFSESGPFTASLVMIINISMNVIDLSLKRVHLDNDKLCQLLAFIDITLRIAYCSTYSIRLQTNDYRLTHDGRSENHL